MEFEVELNGKKKTIKMSEPRGKDQKAYYKQAVKATPKSIEENPQIAVDFLEFRDQMVVRLSNLASVDELDELTMDDKKKLVDFVESKFKLAGDVQKK